MERGVIRFIRPEECKVTRFVRDMQPKSFKCGRNLRAVFSEESEG